MNPRGSYRIGSGRTRLYGDTTVRRTYTLPPELVERLEARAALENRSMSSLVTKLLELALKRGGKR